VPFPVWYYPARRVVPYKLWIGSKLDSENQVAPKRHGVTLIVNCTRNLPFVVKDVQRYRVPVDDAPRDTQVSVFTQKDQRDFIRTVPGAVKLIDAHLRGGGAVLVHCHAGISRSASVAAAYLMLALGIPAAQAMNRVRRLKKETFGPGSVAQSNFADALKALEPVMYRLRTQEAVGAKRTGHAG
jgi:dual specificity phosphatase 12